MKVDQDNFEVFLKISSYYQVEPLKTRCAAVLDSIPATVQRLMLAREHGLTAQYEKFIDQVAKTLSVETANELKSDLSVVKELMDHVAQGAVSICVTNVEGLLILNSCHPIEEVGRQCAPVFSQLKASVPRMILAHELGLLESFD